MHSRIFIALPSFTLVSEMDTAVHVPGFWGFPNITEINYSFDGLQQNAVHFGTLYLGIIYGIIAKIRQE